MLDRQLLRNEIEVVAKRLATRGYTLDVAAFQEIEQKRKDRDVRTQEIQAKLNLISKQIGQAKGKGGDTVSLMLEANQLKEERSSLLVQQSETQEDLSNFLWEVPNIPHESVPLGKSSADNVESRRVGTPRTFGFAPKDHVDLGTALGILDLERASKIAAARFAILNGAGARLSRALVNFMLELHTSEHGYEETLPPFIVNKHALFGTGQLPKFEEDLFKLRDERDLYLVPTAEVPVTNYHREEILDASQLPMKWVAYTPCFRSEAGSYGRDTRGIIRQHQFEKVELVKYALPENSYHELESLTRNAETVLQRLGLHYRVVTLSTADLGFGAAKTYDIEVWLPSQNAFREISSCSNYEAFQARRAQIRFRRSGGEKPEFVHTLNGSGLAIGRTWIAILENYQQADGSVAIPKALRPYMGGLEKISKQ